VSASGSLHVRDLPWSQLRAHPITFTGRSLKPENDSAARAGLLQRVLYPGTALLSAPLREVVLSSSHLVVLRHKAQVNGLGQAEVLTLLCGPAVMLRAALFLKTGCVHSTIRLPG